MNISKFKPKFIAHYATITLTIGICLSSVSCKQQPEEVITPLSAVETELAEIRKLAISQPGAFNNVERLTLLQNTEPESKADYIKLIHETLKAGYSDQSIDLNEQLKATSFYSDFSQAELLRMKKFEAIANLRYGEQLNCILDHSNESCIFPIQGRGVYREKSYTEKAINLYAQILKRNPDDVNVRWLLNVAHMTAGTYPDGLSADQLISLPKEPEDLIAPFVNISSEAGLTDWAVSGGAIIDDFNDDGYLDIVTSSLDIHTPLKLYINDQNGGFKDRSASLSNQYGGLNLIHGDINNDGLPDLFVLRGAWFRKNGEHPNSLLLNLGDGQFRDITKEAGLLSYQPTQAGAFADFNLDGFLDLIVCNESFNKKDKRGVELYLNQGNNTFLEIAQQSGLGPSAYFKGVAAGDYNNDGLPDIYMTNFRGNNYLFENSYDRESDELRFADVSRRTKTAGKSQSFPAWFWDYNNDGWEDIMSFSFGGFFETEKHMAAEYLGLPIAEEYLTGFYVNQGNGTFTDRPVEAGLDKILFAMGANFADVDMDGYLDFYIGTGKPSYEALYPNRMFRNDSGNGFLEVTAQSRTGHLQKGHGIAFGDIDRDGDPDLMANMGGAFSGDIFQNALFENQLQDPQFLILRLIGTESNRSAIGARVRVKVLQDGASRTIYRTISSGGSFGGNSLQCEIGLGEATEIVSLEINWPNKSYQWITYNDIQANSYYMIQEDEPQAQKQRYEEVPFLKDQVHHVHPDIGIAIPEHLQIKTKDEHHHHH